jgi:hypothetical protein
MIFLPTLFTQHTKIFFIFMFSPAQNREKKSQKKNKTSLKNTLFSLPQKTAFFGPEKAQENPA